MRYPIKKARERKSVKSNDALAIELLAKHPSTFVDDKGQPLKPRTLSAKISELDRGITAWWRNRAPATECLIAHLDIEQGELDLNPAGGRNLLSLPSFPAFPPLVMNRETPWRIAEAKRERDPDRDPGRYGMKPTLDFWLEPKRRGMNPERIQWLCVHDDVEFDILICKLATVGKHPVLRAATPEGVITRHIDKLALADSLIVVLDGVGDGEQVGQLASMRQGAPLLIVAHDPLPELAPESEQSEQSEQSSEAKRLAAHVAHSEIECWTWTLLPTWRERLLASIERRMQDLGTGRQFSSKATQALLDKFDRSRQWFVRVDDVLVLCQTVCEGEEENLCDALDSGADTASLLSLLFNRDEAHLDDMRRLVTMRWARWKLSWSADLSLEEWITLTKTKERFETMVSRNLMGQHGLGYRFQRPVVIRLLLRSHLVECMSKDDLDTWAPACFDDERRPFVDAALDALPVNTLQRLARKIGKACVNHNIYRGAAEALFAALGRRMLHANINGQVLAEFGNIVIPKLRKQGGLVWPMSRSLGSPSDELGWISVCWAWSLHAQRLTEGSWQFPGWNAKLAKYPDWIDIYGRAHSAYSWDRLGPQLWDFLSIARTWLEARPRDIDHARLSPLFRMALLLNAAIAGRDAEPWWWEGVIGDPGAEQALIEYGMPDKGTQSRAMVLTWWRSLVRYRHDTFKRQQYAGSTLFSRQPQANGYSPLFAQVIDWLSPIPAKAIQAIDKDDRLFLVRYAVSLPASLQCELLKYVALAENVHWYVWEAPSLMAQFGPQVAESLPDLLDHPQFGGVAALRLWEWAPSRAVGLMRMHRKLSGAALLNIIVACPMMAIDAALAVQRREPSLMTCQQWREWALQRLPDARTHAPALLDLIELAPPSDDGANTTHISGVSK